MDLVFYQGYGYYSEQRDALDRWSRLTGKPLFNGDSAFSVPSEQMPCPLGPHCRDQQDRDRWSVDFAEQALARSDFVGWNHCGWMDGWKSIPGKEVRQHSGLQDPFGRLHARHGRGLQGVLPEDVLGRLESDASPANRKPNLAEFA